MSESMDEGHSSSQRYLLACGSTSSITVPVVPDLVALEY